MDGGGLSGAVFIATGEELVAAKGEVAAAGMMFAAADDAEFAGTGTEFACGIEVYTGLFGPTGFIVG